eukprot:1585244-Prorocentrum_lima.AAC.1
MLAARRAPPLQASSVVTGHSLIGTQAHAGFPPQAATYAMAALSPIGLLRHASSPQKPPIVTHPAS